MSAICVLILRKPTALLGLGLSSELVFSRRYCGEIPRRGAYVPILAVHPRWREFALEPMPVLGKKLNPGDELLVGRLQNLPIHLLSTYEITQILAAEGWEREE